VRITIVYDNTVFGGKVEPDWGFAAVVQTPETTILFDTGTKGTLLMDNLRALGFDPLSIDSVVLSHYHNDHTGGLQSILDVGGRPRVFMPSSFPGRLKTAAADKSDLVPVEKTLEVAPGIFSVIFSRPSGLFRRRMDEQALVATTPEGPVLITGCAHPGIISMVESVSTAPQYHADSEDPDSGRSIALVIGGFHLFKLSRRRVDQIIAEFQSMGVRQVMPAHCTGAGPISWFAEVYGENFISGGVGQTVGEI
jgi:7,8-dihydropterin-6-yl-methyl-4-(beta-D-ribofuranosyl)aminobenzene 5'-phosphate synthase